MEFSIPFCERLCQSVDVVVVGGGGGAPWRRLLLRSEAQLAADPEKKDEVLTALENNRALFEGEGVPAELSQKYQALLAWASNGRRG